MWSRSIMCKHTELIKFLYWEFFSIVSTVVSKSFKKHTFIYILELTPPLYANGRILFNYIFHFPFVLLKFLRRCLGFRACSRDSTEAIQTRLKCMLQMFLQHYRDAEGNENTKGIVMILQWNVASSVYLVDSRNSYD